jgi:hypothetical protein
MAGRCDLCLHARGNGHQDIRLIAHEMPVRGNGPPAFSSMQFEKDPDDAAIWAGLGRTLKEAGGTCGKSLHRVAWRPNSMPPQSHDWPGTCDFSKMRDMRLIPVFWQTIESMSKDYSARYHLIFASIPDVPAPGCGQNPTRLRGSRIS